MSCGPRKATGKTAAITLEVTPNQKKDILAFYVNGAALAVDLELNKNKNPLPDEFFLTTSGCNSPNKELIKSMIMMIYSMINTVGLEENVKINDIVTETGIYRLDASYNAGNFGFSFTSNCDAVSIVTIDKICPTNGLLLKTYCVEKDQWGVYHDGGCGTFNQPIKANAVACGYVSPRPAGELVGLECVDVNQWGIYTDGNYGTYRQLILEKSTDCGYVPPIPSGTLISKECVGVDQIGIYADGNYGTYREAIMVNSAACGYVPPQPSGTLITTECVGVNQVGVYADGNYGTYRSTIVENSEGCGYIKPPSAGREINRYCVEKDLWGIYTDGDGGERRELIKSDSVDCGYTAPPVAGTELGRYCEGANRFARMADGNGGTTNQLIMENSPECGFTPTNPTISLTASHSTINKGDTETLTANFYGFEPNKRYSVTWNTQCSAEFNGIATVIKTDYIQTNGNGDTLNPLTLSLTDTGVKPRGIYDTWVECSEEYSTSNHVMRNFIGVATAPTPQTTPTTSPTSPTTPTSPSPSGPSGPTSPTTPSVTYNPTLTLTKSLSNVPWFQKQTLTCTLNGGDPSLSYTVYFKYTGSSGGSFISEAYIRPNSSGYGTGTCEVGNYDPAYPSRGAYCDISYLSLTSNTVTWVNDAYQANTDIFESINIKALTYVPGATVDQMPENTYITCYFASGASGIPGMGLVLKVPNVSTNPQIVKKDGSYEPLKWSNTDGWYTDIFTSIPRDYTLKILI